jgi:hypothetical protein
LQPFTFHLYRIIVNFIPALPVPQRLIIPPFAPIVSAKRIADNAGYFWRCYQVLFMVAYRMWLGIIDIICSWAYRVGNQNNVNISSAP